MKRLLSLTLLLAAIGFTTLPAEAKTAASTLSGTSNATTANALDPQWGNRYRRDRRNDRYRRNGRVRVTTQSRLVRVGRRIYRETYQVRYLPNGRVQTRLISRVRVR